MAIITAGVDVQADGLREEVHRIFPNGELHITRADLRFINDGWVQPVGDWVAQKLQHQSQDRSDPVLSSQRSGTPAHPGLDQTRAASLRAKLAKLPSTFLRVVRHWGAWK